jgi:hypothetical protein
VNAFLPSARGVIAVAAAYAVVLSLLVAGLGTAVAGFDGATFCRSNALDAPAEHPAPAKPAIPHDCCFGCPAGAADLPGGTQFGNPKADLRSTELALPSPRLLAASDRMAHPPRGPPV